MNPPESNCQMASLYVGGLSKEVTEADLLKKFSSVGPVLSVRVCRALPTGRSLGYAYVNFQNPSDAERAMNTMNFDLLKNYPIRIMRCQRDPLLRQTGVGNIFIKNLDKTIDNKAFYDTFVNFGDILSCKVAQDEKGNSKGFGFVHFRTEKAAEECIKKVNGMKLRDKIVYVGKFIPHQERESELGEKGKKLFTNVYVKNFSENFDDEKLKEMFEPFGKITSHKIDTTDDGKSKGFGFVAFETAEAAQAAINNLNGKEIGENKLILYVGPAQKKAEREIELRRKFELHLRDRQETDCGINLFVKNFDNTIDGERLRKEFAPYGTVVSAKVMTDEKGHSKGFGFVYFNSVKEGIHAVTALNGHLLGSNRLYVALAQHKHDRSAYLSSQYMCHSPSRSRTQQIYRSNSTDAFQGFYRSQVIPPIHENIPRWAEKSNAARRYPLTSTRNSITSQHRQMVLPVAASVPAQIQPLQPEKVEKRQIASLLKNVTIEEQRQILGEHLYPSIYRMYPNLAAKITGMLLEINISELLDMTEDQEALSARVEEAIEVLQEHHLIEPKK